jgi:hypothetical protein
MTGNKSDELDMEERVSAAEDYLEVARQKILKLSEEIGALRQEQAAFKDSVAHVCEMILTQMGLKNAQRTVEEFLKR